MSTLVQYHFEFSLKRRTWTVPLPVTWTLTHKHSESSQFNYYAQCCRSQPIVLVYIPSFIVTIVLFLLSTPTNSVCPSARLIPRLHGQNGGYPQSGQSSAHHFTVLRSLTFFPLGATLWCHIWSCYNLTRSLVYRPWLISTEICGLYKGVVGIANRLKAISASNINP
jgi:hypothetical protein